MWRGIIFAIVIALGGAVLLGWAPSPTSTGAASLTTDQGNTDFDVTVTTQGRCGPTCLNTTQATNIEITAQVFPGYVESASSATTTAVYRTEEQVGTLAPGERKSIDRSVRWGSAEALSVKDQGGRVTILIEIQSTDTEVTFREHYDLI
ncbi:hypothetical protein [Haloquadratum walsbyi]|uniref:hypothetical protein n=1 Tax=Haloquadratum walsbyi TaxID=293091 RepID=UPI0015F38E71|nr:hypothetical protein [Haloquadratum walsbyi]